jgi:phage I-like protein
MENPGRAEKLVGSLPQLGETATASKRPQPAGTATLSSEQAQVAEMLGIDPEKYAAQLKADGLDQEAL